MIVVIGAGASGMMAAISAAEAGAKVTLIEKSKRCGLKLGITGKGRCNLTNASDLDELRHNTVKNGKFLFSSYSGFSSQKTIEYFESLGVPLKVERGKRVFPVSDRALDIVDALVKRLKALKVNIVKGQAVSIDIKDGQVAGVLTKDSYIECSRVILATGGLSYPATGSDGDGFRMAKELGHTVTELKPSLTALICADKDIKALEGLSLKNIAITVKKEKRVVYKDFGEMLFTSNGVSGPVILSASAVCVAKKSFPCRLDIDLKPALSPDELDKRLLKDFNDNINRDFSNSLNKLLPSKLIPVIIERSGIAPDTKVNAITKKQRETLAVLLKCMSFEVIKTAGFSEAVVTSGGIKVQEIDPGTLESKKIKGLYFSGEIIDVDAYTGGFNLQIAWSTGYKAGKSAAKEEV